MVDPALDTIETTITLNYADPARLYYSQRGNMVACASAGLFCGSGGAPLIDRSGIEVFSARPPYLLTDIIAGDDPGIQGNIFDLAVDARGSAYFLVATGVDNKDRALKLDLSTRVQDPGF